jgi:F1F0 ATPase subunit 2
MTMSDVLALVLASIAGLLLGAIFFGALYLTVRKGVSSPAPALWFFGSLVMRMGIALAGFYFVSDGSWQRMVACILGFVVARLVVTWLTRPAGQQQASSGPGGRHAP